MTRFSQNTEFLVHQAVFLKLLLINHGAFTNGIIWMVTPPSVCLYMSLAEQISLKIKQSSYSATSVNPLEGTDRHWLVVSFFMAELKFHSPLAANVNPKEEINQKIKTSN